jgi:hypothetical protein
MQIKKDSRYEKSKVYKLIDTINGYFYIGSTCTTLTKRLYSHKGKAKMYPERKVYKYLNEVGWDNVKIVLVSEHHLENKNQLLRIENDVIQLHIQDVQCLNSLSSFQSIEEKKLYREQWTNNNKERLEKWYFENKERLTLYKKQWKEENKEEIKQKNQEYYKKNKDELRQKNKEYYIKNKEKIIEYVKQFSTDNREKISEYKKNWYKERKQKQKQDAETI